MGSFSCKHCGYDLSVGIDCLALAVQEDYQDKDFPSELCIEGVCNDCRNPFIFEGELFTYFILTKAAEGVISPAVKNSLLIDLDISEEDAEEIERLLKEKNSDGVQDLVRELMKRKDKD